MHFAVNGSYTFIQNRVDDGKVASQSGKKDSLFDRTIVHQSGFLVSQKRQTN